MKTIKVDNRLLSADVVVDNIAYACDYGEQYYAVLSNGQTVVITAEDYAKIVDAGMFVEVGEGFRTTQLNVSKVNFVDDDEAVLVGGVSLNLDDEQRETVKAAIAAYSGGGGGAEGTMVQTMDNPSADTYPSTIAVKDYVDASKAVILYYDPANDVIRDEKGEDYSYIYDLKPLFENKKLVLLSMYLDNQTVLLWPNVRLYRGQFYEIQWNGFSYAEGDWGKTDTIQKAISVKVDYDDNIRFLETPYTPLKTWSGTQDAYDALATKDLVSTLYLIEEDA